MARPKLLSLAYRELKTVTIGKEINDRPTLPTVKTPTRLKRQHFTPFYMVQRCNVTQPNVTQPNVTQPNVTQPNVTQPNVTQPNVTWPNVAFFNVTRPNVTLTKCHFFQYHPSECRLRQNVNVALGFYNTGPDSPLLGP
jgi:hypothetical protein